MIQFCLSCCGSSFLLAAEINDAQRKIWQYAVILRSGKPAALGEDVLQLKQ